MSRREVYWSDFNPNVPLRTLISNAPESFWQAMMENREDEYESDQALIDLREAVTAAFESLSDRDQFLLRARLFEGRSIREVGVQMGMSHVNVLRLQRAALDQLRSTLSGHPLIQQRGWA